MRPVPLLHLVMAVAMGVETLGMEAAVVEAITTTSPSTITTGPSTIIIGPTTTITGQLFSFRLLSIPSQLLIKLKTSLVAPR